jgi:GST-like protein
MIDLYALTSPNVQKIFIALEELELPYNTHIVDVWKGDQFTPEFTKVNPNQKVPTIVDHDGPGGKPYTVIESGAILLYLAEKTKKLLPTDPAKRFDAIQWLFLQHAGVGPMCGQLVHFSRFAPKGGNDYANSRYRSEVNRLFDLYDQRLGQYAYVGGDEYSIADIAAFPWLRNVELLGIDLGRRPHVKQWVEKLNERPAVKRALAKVATITSERDTASDIAKDRLFGRGQFARA